MQAELAEPPGENQTDELLRGALQQFGFERFSPEQDEIIRASVAGRDVLGVLPTGGGKSACFQIPGIVTRSKTVVVSPLIALQDDQVRALRRLGVKAFALHSNQPESNKQAIHYYFANAPKDEPSFLYVSPELLLTEMFHQRFDRAGFDRIAVDEAHCVSTWGDGFRPDYQRIRIATKRLRIPHCSAYTATVDPKIRKDIQKRIPLRSDFLMVEADPMRPNLELRVEFPASVEDHAVLLGKKRFNRLLDLLSNKEYVGPTIVYCGSRNATVRAWERMQKGFARDVMRRHGYTVYFFHGGIDFYEIKEKALHGFLDDRRPIIFATSAFGMGINRSDVRQVIHYHVPNTLIDYAQQIGRAGRDGLPALCTTFCLEGDDFERQTRKARWNAPSYDFVERVHANLRNVLKNRSHAEGRNYNIRSFLTHMRMRVEKSDKIQFKESYMARLSAAIAILQRVGVIHEDGTGLTVFGIMPGTKQHADLLGKTYMHERMLVREQERLRVFFGQPDQDQQRLWEILRWDEDLEARKENPAESVP